MDKERPTARAVVVHDGVIEYVGDDAGAARVDRGVDVKIDAKGRTLMPGFNDAHGHYIHEGLMATRLDLSKASGASEVYRLVKEYRAANPELDAIIAERWDDGQWVKSEYPTREGLDEACGDRPVLARRVDGHTAVANSALLDVYRQRWEGSWEGIDEKTGLLLEEPSLDFNMVLPPTDDQLDQAIARFMKIAAREGTTSLQDFSNPDYARAWRRYYRKAERGSVQPAARLGVSTYVEHLKAHVDAGFITGTGGPFLRLGGVKIFADGSVGGRTALLREPYADADTRGVRIFSDEEMLERVRMAHEGGVQVRMHVIGDAAVEQGTRAFETVAEEVGLEAFHAMRHRFEHYEMNDEVLRRRAKTLGLVLSMQPNFVGAWSRQGGLYDRRLGDRHRAMNPVRTILEEGLHVAFGSDCMPFGPLTGLRGIMGAPYDVMRPSVQDALAAYTRGAAFGEHEEHVKGTIKDGYYGDLVLLSQDVMGVADERKAFDDVGVALTVCDGRAVHREG
jgi:predicted amidohydrolase YtcJ